MMRPRKADDLRSSGGGGGASGVGCGRDGVLGVRWEGGGGGGGRASWGTSDKVNFSKVLDMLTLDKVLFVAK